MGGKESNIQETEHWFIGEDRDIQMPMVDVNGAAVDMSGWTLEFVLYDRRGGTALITKSSPTLSDSAGTNDLATVTILSSDYTLVVKSRTYWYEWHRTDSGDEAVLASGQAVIRAGGLS